MSKDPIIDNLSYYSETFRKIQNKKYELYVITRIFHTLNDLEIDLSMQQAVITKDGVRLMDLYFPQFKLCLEIDEPHHEDSEQKNKDEIRKEAIVEIAKVEVIRIGIKGKSIEEINIEIDGIVAKIKEMKARQVSKGSFQPYSFNAKYSLENSIAKGEIHATDDVRFRIQGDALKIFGIKSSQKGIYKYGGEHRVWFPKLYTDKHWINSISDDGKTINMKPQAGGEYSNSISPHISKKQKSIVFAHHIDFFGQVFYSFRGIFQETYRDGDKSEYTRISDCLKIKKDGTVDDAQLP